MKNKKMYKIIRNIFITLGILFLLSALILFIVYNTSTTKIEIFLESELTIEQENEIKEKIESICNTDDIQYISKDEALQKMKQTLGNEAYVLNNYSEDNNIFPSSYIVQVHFNKQNKIVEEIQNIKGVKNIKYTSFYKTILYKFYNSKQKNNEKTNKEIDTKLDSIIKDNIFKYVNNGNIYIDDVAKIISIDNIYVKENIDNIKLGQIDITYEKSSLSAPIGTNYKGQSYKGTYYFAYKNDTKQIFKYIFSYDDYNKLKGWSTQGRKNDNNFWID